MTLIGDLQPGDVVLLRIVRAGDLDDVGPCLMPSGLWVELCDVGCGVVGGGPWRLVEFTMVVLIVTGRPGGVTLCTYPGLGPLWWWREGGHELFVFVLPRGGCGIYVWRF